MLRLYLDAPFAVCRTFSAGWYRPTATFLTPSAAYGLLMNVAGIDTRLREECEQHDGKTPASLMRTDLPSVRIALGAVAETTNPFPIVQTVFQQLHNYPVGSDAGTSAELAKGNKNNITPVRREFLSDLRAIIVLRANDALESRVGDGLAGRLNDGRYGLPFLGDNGFLPSRLEIDGRNRPVRWYEPVSHEAAGPRLRATRLTVWIDRADTSKTVSGLYAPSETAAVDPPDTAWTLVGPDACPARRVAEERRSL